MILGKIVAWPIRYVLLIAKLLAGFPLAAVYTRSPYITIWLVAVYVLLLVFLLSRNRGPGVLLCCGTLGLCLALLASWAEPMLDSTRITVLDVGQGQCILLQSEGRTYMVDCGGDSDTETADIAAETLLSQGISRLDGLILTHGDRDHTGAAENLLSRVKADILILPPEEGILVADNAEVVYAEQDLLLTYGKTNLHIFTTDSNRSENENSLCVLFDTENCDILITGDRSAYGERILLHAGKIPEVDVLIAGHHGSKTLPARICLPLPNRRRSASAQEGTISTDTRRRRPCSGWKISAARCTGQTGTEQLPSEGEAMAKNQPRGNLQELKTQLKNKDLGRLYIFHGEEVFLLHHYLEQMKSSCWTR